MDFKRGRGKNGYKGTPDKKIETRRGVKQRINSTQSHRVREQLRRKYSKLDHEVKKMTKLGKRIFVERLVVEAEEAACKQDFKTLYRINKMLNNCFKNNDVPVKDRWQCYFKGSRKAGTLEGIF